jgi:cystathionine beta-lyase
LIFRGHVHIPTASLPELSGAGVITCLSATKTFNLAGLQSSATVFSDAADQARFEAWWRKLDIHRNNCFGLVAVEAAFRHGAEWLDQLLEYLEGNFRFLRDYCAHHIPAVKPNLPEGTYLVWLDCRGLGLTGADLPRFMARKAGLGLGEGATFGPGGEGFMRLNAACPRSVLRQALERLQLATAELKKEAHYDHSPDD